MNINDLKMYFFKIDSSRNGNLEAEEIENAKKEGSIFSTILEVNMNYETYIQKIVSVYREQIDDFNADKNVPYRKETSPEAQSQIWDEASEVVTQEYINTGDNRFNINTAEGIPVSKELDFNSEDGIYMLKHLSFDSETFKNIPSKNLPKDFNPDAIIENGKNPGINIRKMHLMGYTGKNVIVACIDTPILTEHSGIKSNIIGYEVMDKTFSQEEAYYHGQAVADILAGKETGTAPDSKLIYFAGSDFGDDRLQALKRIVEINRASDEQDKIKVLSISWDVDESEEIYPEYKALIQELVKDDVFIATAGDSMINGVLGGVMIEKGCLEKINQMGNPDDFSNYTGTSDYGAINPEKTLFVPAGDRTVASAMGENKYRHDSKASTSWSVPALAGIYASTLQCAKEHNITLTPEKFRDWALETGVPINNRSGDFAGYAIDAEALCKKIIDKGAEAHKFGL